MNYHPRKVIDPLAAHLDAMVEAEHAGVCDSDVETLIEIGEDIADFSRKIAAKLMSLSDGRMQTTTLAHGARRQQAVYRAPDLTALIAEDVGGNLDAYDVIRTASVLRAMRPTEIDRAVKALPTDRIERLVQREQGA
jgi:hypothetical protein